MKTRIALAALLACAGAATAQNGGDGERISLALNGGWMYDELEEIGSPTSNSPIEFTLDAPAYFRITDDFVFGDVWTAVGLGNTTQNGPQAPTIFGGPGEEAWQNPTYGHLEVILAPGFYSFIVTGDGAGGLPAGVYLQLESIPGPGALTMLTMGGALASRRRR